jgi:pantoate--beta-alanine ligase
MHIFRTKQEISNFIEAARQENKGKIAFAPTMGALHEGHLSLIKLAKQHADIAICSIFVNPTQFGPNEDFNKYPRDEKSDCKMLELAGCDAVFIPSVEEMYGKTINYQQLTINKSDILCGAFRPGHFAGVVQVVGKLFEIVKPDVAIFGEKDFQQLWILRDNFKNINIIGAPIVREPDGLALSSRNQYLTESERKHAAKLHFALKEALKRIKNNGSIESSLNDAKSYLIDSGFNKVDYIEAREEDTLEITKAVSDKTRLFAAAWLKNTRLIDNLSVG